MEHKHSISGPTRPVRMLPYTYHFLLPLGICFWECMTIPHNVSKLLVGCVIAADEKDGSSNLLHDEAERLEVPTNEAEKVTESAAASEDVHVGGWKMLVLSQ